MHTLLMLGLLLAAPGQSSAPRGAAGADSPQEIAARCYANPYNAIDACTQAFIQLKDPREQAHVLLAKGILLTNAKNSAVATAVFKQALTLTPHDANAHLIYAWALDAAGDRPGADAEYSQALLAGLAHDSELQLNPTVITIIRNMAAEGNFYYTVGQAFERNGRKPLAKAFYLYAAGAFETRLSADVLDAYNAAIRMDPKDADTHYRLATFWSKFDGEHSAEVIHQLEEAVRLAPDDADYRNELAHRYVEAGDTGKAVEQLHEAVRIKPDYQDAKNELALAVVASGEVAVHVAQVPDSPEALEQLRMCIDEDGTRGELACRRALKIGLSPHPAAEAHTFLAQQLSGERAVAEFHAAIQSDANYALPYYLLAQSVASSSPQKEDPAPLLEAAARLRPDWTAPREQLAALLWLRKRYVEAIAAQHEAAAIDPEDLSLAARAKEWEGNLASYQEQLQKASAEILSTPDDANAHQRLGVAFATMGRDDEARTQYRAAFKLNPRRAWMMASSILYTGFPDVACDIYQQTRIEETPDLPQSGLESELDTCARMFPKDTKSLTHLAELQLKRGDLGAARRSYEEALKRDPDYFDKYPQQRALYDRSRSQKGT